MKGRLKRGPSTVPRQSRGVGDGGRQTLSQTVGKVRPARLAQNRYMSRPQRAAPSNVARLDQRRRGPHASPGTLRARPPLAHAATYLLSTSSAAATLGAGNPCGRVPVAGQRRAHACGYAAERGREKGGRAHRPAPGSLEREDVQHPVRGADLRATTP